MDESRCGKMEKSESVAEWEGIFVGRKERYQQPQ
jgi:hypothetical protein